MGHAIPLRVIGQSLEAAKLETFELETDGLNYIVRSDDLTTTSEWILRNTLGTDDFTGQSARQSTAEHSVCFTSVDTARLDNRAQKQRKPASTASKQTYRRLSQLLRTLGDHLDRTGVSTFRISWTSNAVSVNFSSADAQNDFRSFTTEKLEQLASLSRFRRAIAPSLNSAAASKRPPPRNR